MCPPSILNVHTDRHHSEFSRDWKSSFLTFKRNDMTFDLGFLTFEILSKSAISFVYFDHTVLYYDWLPLPLNFSKRARFVSARLSSWAVEQSWELIAERDSSSPDESWDSHTDLSFCREKPLVSKLSVRIFEKIFYFQMLISQLISERCVRYFPWSSSASWPTFPKPMARPTRSASALAPRLAMAQ